MPTFWSTRGILFNDDFLVIIVVVSATSGNAKDVNHIGPLVLLWVKE
jgi:hypothetical protein